MKAKAKVNASLRLIVLAALASGVATAADEPQGDLARFQGTWAAKTGPQDAWTVRMTFQGNKVKIAWPSDADTIIDLTSEIGLDEKAEPKRLRFVNLRTADGGDVDDTSAIYAIEKDGIKLCIARPGTDRPAEFKGSNDPDDRYPSLLLLKPQPAAAPAGDLAALQGTWTAKTGPDHAWDFAITIVGNAYKTTWPTDATSSIEVTGEFKVDEKATPRRIDFVNQHKDDGAEVKDTAGIYAIEKDGVRLCFARPGTDRPAEFRGATEGRYPTLLMLKKK